MKQKTSKIILRGVLYGSCAVLLTCGIFLYRGRQRLVDLITHSTPRGTEVFSVWLPLREDPSVTADYVQATLDMLGYERVAKPPQKAGQYFPAPSSLDIWTRGFEFPDLSLPPQQIRVTFHSGQVSRIETLPDGKRLEEWRLEPKRLARWALQAGASQPKIRFEELPAYVPMAVVAIEDKRFFKHGAIDVRGLGRAVWVNLSRGGLRQGGSTITQQLSRSIFLDIQRTWTRKLLEAGLAFFLEMVYSKQQLLEMYLNQVYWGHDGMDTLVGLESTSRSFFAKSARELTVGESALLAGLLQSPNRYSPRSDARRAKQRRNLVLSLMHEQDHITDAQFRAALIEPIHLAPLPPRAGQAPYFVATLQDQLVKEYSFGMLMSQGWKIFATLDPVLQGYAVNALKPSEGQAAMVVIDPRTGAVRAWVGGTGYGKSTFDRVVYARRQPGSAFKPFVALAAIEERVATEATVLDDKPIKLSTPQGTWTPQNYDRKYRDKVSLWDALVLSLNIPMVNLAMQTGLNHVVDVAHRAGIQSPLRAVPSMALGTSEVTVLEITGAYATLANGGVYNAPYTIESIRDLDQRVVESHTPHPQVAVSEASAFIVTHILRAVLEEGTARLSRQMGFKYSAAGKTGTSENYQDAWFIGYTPRLVCGVWVGHDQPKPLGRSAAGIALPLWVSFMQKALALTPEEKWPEPKGVAWKTIDSTTGEAARSGCTQRRKEAFLPGTEPEKMCTLHPGGIIGFFHRLRHR